MEAAECVQPDNRVIVQQGLSFDELETSVTCRHATGRTIGEGDNTLFTTLTMNPQSLHLDAAASDANEFRQRLVIRLLRMSLFVGLSVGHRPRARSSRIWGSAR